MSVPAARARVGVAFVVTILLWGSAFPAIRYAVRFFSPAHLTLLRFLFGCAAMTIIAVVGRVPIPPARLLPRVALIGVMGSVGYHLALNFGLRTVSAAAGSLIVNLSPVLTAILARTYLRERMAMRGWSGLALAVAGGAVIASGELAARKVGVRMAPTGVLLLLFCACCWSVVIIIQKPLMQRVSPSQVGIWSVLIGAVPLLAFSGGLPASVASAPREALAAVAYLGIGPIGVAYLTWNYCLHRLPASKLSAATYVLPAVAMLVAWVWPGEAPKAATVAGGGIALLGVVLVTSDKQISAAD
ncbi:MAG: DMT family transporter [Armatimonadetes bacterium]|nr:DMT family transporter [Armatimonadota bacterium]